MFESRPEARSFLTLEDTENLPDPDVLAAEIVENLQAALEQLSGIRENWDGVRCVVRLKSSAHTSAIPK